MKIKELKTEIEMTLERKQNLLSSIKSGEDNPQVVAVKNELQTSIGSLQAILNRINGDRLAIHIL